jgi:1-phosphofructokinase
MPPIITLTLNPAIDETIVLDHLRPGHVHRAAEVTHHAGGKGINVASCLADWNLPVIATGILGAANATPFATLFTTKRITDRCLRIPGETRTNIKLAHDGDTTDINLPGLTPDAATLANIETALTSLATPDSLILLAGSLPAATPEDFYARLIATLATAGARVILDSSGAPLARALAGKTLPFCIKPNRAELEAFAGHPLPTTADLLAVAQSLRASGVALVVISLGAEGAIFAGAQTLHARLPARRATSTVGAGDAMVAGIIAGLAEAAAPDRLARLATAFAVAKLGQPGPNLPPRAQVEALAAAVHIENLKGAQK